MLPDGEAYTGEFKDGQYNGKGVLIKVNGEMQPGVWTDGSFTEEWTFEAVDKFLKNRHPQFRGFDYERLTTGTSLLKSDASMFPPPADRAHIAVIDLAGNNVSVDNCKVLTDRLRIELNSTKYYRVVERETMEQLLGEHGFHQSDYITTERMVDAGRQIGVEKIVGGIISKVGNVYSVSARMISVETGEIESTGLCNHTGNMSELLTDGMKRVASDMIK
jgi:hypothetical protein